MLDSRESFCSTIFLSTTFCISSHEASLLFHSLRAYLKPADIPVSENRP